MSNEDYFEICRNKPLVERVLELCHSIERYKDAQMHKEECRIFGRSSEEYRYEERECVAQLERAEWLYRNIVDSIKKL